MDKSKGKKIDTTTNVTPFWHGWSDLDRVFDNFRRDFERAFAAFPVAMPSLPSISTTSCDVIDEGNRFVVNVDLPGVKKNEIKLNVTDTAIEVSAEHKEEDEEKKKNYVRKERKEVSYHRTMSLPEKVISSKATAKLNNGVLSVEIPKVTPTLKPKSTSIPIQ
ncbi:MAG TPA: Hsp20/alpha crystallin family protein [Nitrosopumilaceae archaeon]|nr:Hsp20/alpha crystallin family protein [Nitrosopumilaceae archaeon]